MALQCRNNIFLCFHICLFLSGEDHINKIYTSHIYIKQNAIVLSERFSFLRIISVFLLVTVPYGTICGQMLLELSRPISWVAQLPFANKFSLAYSNWNGFLSFSWVTDGHDSKIKSISDHLKFEGHRTLRKLLFYWLKTSQYRIISFLLVLLLTQTWSFGHHFVILKDSIKKKNPYIKDNILFNNWVTTIYFCDIP